MNAPPLTSIYRIVLLQGNEGEWWSIALDEVGPIDMLTPYTSTDRSREENSEHLPLMPAFRSSSGSHSPLLIGVPSACCMTTGGPQGAAARPRPVGGPPRRVAQAARGGDRRRTHPRPLLQVRTHRDLFCLSNEAEEQASEECESHVDDPKENTHTCVRTTYKLRGTLLWPHSEAMLL